MSKQDGLNWAKKAYLWLSLAVVAVIWICFFFHFAVFGHSPVEANWFEEVMKWVVMTIVLVPLVDCIFYAWIATVASRKGDGIDTSFWQELKDLFKKKETVVEEVETVEEQPVEETVEEVVEEAAPVKRTRKKKVVEE